MNMRVAMVAEDYQRRKYADVIGNLLFLQDKGMDVHRTRVLQLVRGSALAMEEYAA